MGFLDFLRSLFAGARTDEFGRVDASLPPGKHDVAELARRLEMDLEVLKSFGPTYHTFAIPKRSGGLRQISAPDPELKTLQRRILRRLLGRLKVHPAVTGFQKGHSIVTHAALHTDQAVVLRLDIRDFFASTSARRVRDYFRRIGWTDDAARVLTRLTTHEAVLPQGAPTSPRLSNLVNYLMDARLEGLAHHLGARYSRYADDLTFSLAEDDAQKIRSLIVSVTVILHESAYRLRRQKLRIRRRHQQQCITGLVVNGGAPRLPRRTRRWLRAVEHHLATGREATLTPAQLEGWKNFRSMIERQREAMT